MFAQPVCFDNMSYARAGYTDDEASPLHTREGAVYHSAEDPAVHNIDPSLCALEHPGGASASTAFPSSSSVGLSWSIAAQRYASPSIYEYGLASTCDETDPYMDSDAMPSTPDDRSSDSCVPPFPFSPAAASVCVGAHPSLQSSLLSLASHHMLGDGSAAGAVAAKGFHAMLPADCDAADSSFAYRSQLDSNSCLPVYNPLDRGFTLQSNSASDEADPLTLYPAYVGRQASLSSFPLSPSLTAKSVYFASSATGLTAMSPKPIKEGDTICVMPAPQPEPPVKRRRSTAAVAAAAASSASARSMSPRRHSRMKVEPKPEPSASPALAAVSGRSASAGSSSAGRSSCADCPLVFDDAAQLKMHRKKMHEQPFVCIFHWAGCPSRFGNKNEWKRHVTTQHVMLAYWRCDDDKCTKMRHNYAATARPYGYANANIAEPACSGIFNRKDLFTQHVRRMHMPEHLKALERSYRDEKRRLEEASGGRASRNGKGNGLTKKRKRSAGSDSAEAACALPLPAALDDWDRELKALQSASQVERCRLPTTIMCPQCQQDFHGLQAWNERMEHVADHMQQAYDQGCRETWPFDGVTDPTLTRWAERNDVQIIRRCHAGGRLAWELNKPLEQLMGESDEDGEGDVEFSG